MAKKFAKISNTNQGLAKKKMLFRLKKTQSYFSATHQKGIEAPGSKSLAGVRLAPSQPLCPGAVDIIQSGLTNPFS